MQGKIVRSNAWSIQYIFYASIRMRFGCICTRERERETALSELPQMGRMKNFHCKCLLVSCRKSAMALNTVAYQKFGIHRRILKYSQLVKCIKLLQDCARCAQSNEWIRKLLFSRRTIVIFDIVIYCFQRMPHNGFLQFKEITFCTQILSLYQILSHTKLRIFLWEMPKNIVVNLNSLV